MTSPAAEPVPPPGSPAVVLVSGGLDSATTLAIARERGHRCHALSFDYGQRHAVELAAARRVAAALGAVEHRVLAMPIGQFGHSALTDPAIAVPESPGEGIPVTYVPARNTIFLACALGHAEVIGAQHIYIGVNAVDYSGYPDCRPGVHPRFRGPREPRDAGGRRGPARVHPRAAHRVVQGGHHPPRLALGVDYAMTVSCYQPDEDGRACGRCDSCRLRGEGFRAAGVADPTRYR